MKCFFGILIGVMKCVSKRVLKLKEKVYKGSTSTSFVGFKFILCHKVSNFYVGVVRVYNACFFLYFNFNKRYSDRIGNKNAFAGV